MTRALTTILLLPVVLLVFVFGLIAGAAPGLWSEPEAWPDALDITVVLENQDGGSERWDPGITVPLDPALPVTTGPATGPDVMICIVDEAGHARCHHRDGVLASTVGAGGHRACPGAERALLSRCGDASRCVFRNVPVPADSFGLLILELDPPLFGVPRHGIIDAVVLARSEAPAAPGDTRVAAGLRTLAQCLAPPGRQHGLEPELPVVLRTACEDHACTLRHSRVGLATRPSGAVARP